MLQGPEVARAASDDAEPGPCGSIQDRVATRSSSTTASRLPSSNTEKDEKSS